jgi:hypothetical protein
MGSFLAGVLTGLALTGLAVSVTCLAETTAAKAGGYPSRTAAAAYVLLMDDWRLPYPER